MPRFTLIKHADNQFDSEIKMEFEAEVLDLARAHYEDFLTASGFVSATSEETTFQEWNSQKDDDMWNDAFAAKFSHDEVYSSPTPSLKNDGILGVTGEDNIIFGNFPHKPSIPRSNDTIFF